MDFLDIFQLKIIYFTIISFLIIFSVNKIFVKFLVKIKIFDIHEKNNNNFIYTGFGFSFTIITLLYLLWFLIFNEQNYIYYHIKYLPIPLSIMIIGTIGFLDDYRGTPVHLRLILFFMCCFLSTSALNNNILFFISFHKLQLAILTLTWVYFLNASNFLDGGDRFSINFILPNSLFFIFYYYFINEDFLRLQINILVFLFIIHFSFYNRDPNKFFLGDTGSLVFGYIHCFNVFNLIENNEFVLGVLLSLYIVSDVSITLFIRILNKKNIFTRHKGFFIHVSKFLGRSTNNIANSILLTNISLVTLGIIYKWYYQNILLLILGFFIIIFYLSYLIKFNFKNLKYIFQN